MTQEDKNLLLIDLSARLPYGVKILHTGWDYDSDTDFDTVETLIGIDDKFIYTVWDKTGDREMHCLSVFNWKPYLRPMSSMTEKEKRELQSFYPGSLGNQWLDTEKGTIDIFECSSTITLYLYDSQRIADWLNKNMFDYRGLIEKGLALEAPEGMYTLNK